MKTLAACGFFLAVLPGMAGAPGVIIRAQSASDGVLVVENHPLAGARGSEQGHSMPADHTSGLRPLPQPALTGPVSLEEAIALRRSQRRFTDQELTVSQTAQLCWAGQGITDPKRGFRACPSAGALYPLELYVVTAAGVDRYKPAGHALVRVRAGDVRRELRHAALEQEPVGEAPLCVVIAAVVQRTARKYGPRAERYCHLEAGHVAQNIMLQATALNLGGVTVGAFDDDKVAALLQLPEGHRVLYLLPIGHQ